MSLLYRVGWGKQLHILLQVSTKSSTEGKTTCPGICLSLRTAAICLKKDAIFWYLPSKWRRFPTHFFGGGNLFGIKIHLIICPSCISENTMETQPFEDVFPIETGGFSNVMLVFRGVSQFVFQSTPDRFQHTEIWCRAKKEVRSNQQSKPEKPTCFAGMTKLLQVCSPTIGFFSA